MFKTWVTETLGVKYPIIQGGMQWLSTAELASAVSNAGGLGIIASNSFSTAEELRQEIRKMKALTDKPFAVNITLMPRKVQVNWEEFIVVAIEEGVSIFETSGRSPEPYMGLFKQAKARVLHKAARIMDARTAEQVGADAVTILGFEGGGHPGPDEVASVVLIPGAVDAVKIPVIAAGGFGDGRGLVAALALGAQGILMGTRFMASRECQLHPKIRELIARTESKDAIVIERSIRNTSRVIRTDFALKILEMEKRGVTLDDLYPLIAGTRIRDAYTSGDANDAILYCGQVAGLIRTIPSVKEIIEGIMEQAERVGERLKKMGVLS